MYFNIGLVLIKFYNIRVDLIEEYIFGNCLSFIVIVGLMFFGYWVEIYFKVKWEINRLLKVIECFWVDEIF